MAIEKPPDGDPCGRRRLQPAAVAETGRSSRGPGIDPIRGINPRQALIDVADIILADDGVPAREQALVVAIRHRARHGLRIRALHEIWLWVYYGKMRRRAIALARRYGL